MANLAHAHRYQVADRQRLDNVHLVNPVVGEQGAVLWQSHRVAQPRFHRRFYLWLRLTHLALEPRRIALTLYVRPSDRIPERRQIITLSSDIGLANQRYFDANLESAPLAFAPAQRVELEHEEIARVKLARVHLTHAR